MNALRIWATALVVAQFLSPLAQAAQFEADQLEPNVVAKSIAAAPVVTISASTATLTATQCQISLTGSGVQTITLPAASAAKCAIWLKDSACNAGTYSKAILPTGSDTIDGQWTAGNGGVGLYDDCEARTLIPVSGGWLLR